jgi:hypothetical protein
MRMYRKHKFNYLNFWITVFQKCLVCFSAFVCIEFALSQVAYSQSVPSKEDQIKAAYIFNFAKFTTWPASKFSEPGSPLIIGIFGEDPFGVLIDELVKGELVQGRPIEIKRYKDSDQISYCHVFYVHHSNNVDLEDIIRKLESLDVLTISDIDNFTEKGGIVKFFQDDGKMKFEINGQVVKNSRLMISSRLLRLAEICCNEKTDN